MIPNFENILAIARENVRKNPSIVKTETVDVALRYLKGLKEEVEEVQVEIKEKNSVYLTDELSDIAWDYAVLIALLETRGFIESAEEVLAHGCEKYSERAPAFLEESNEQWNAVKTKQKAELKKKHEAYYGN